MKPLLHVLSPAGRRSRLSVLIFHRVLPEQDPLFPGEMHRRRFDAVLGWLRDWFNVLPLDEAIRALKEGRLPARAAALSFDDGYADNHDIALPLLQRYGLPCSFFIATDFLDGGRMWNDTLIEAVRRSPLASLDLRGIDFGGRSLGALALTDVPSRQAAISQLIGACKYLDPELRAQVVAAVAGRAEARLPDDLMMTSAQVRALRAAGMQIGGHTGSHPILARLDAANARTEMERGKKKLESVIGESVTVFAYPNGKPGADYDPARDPGLVRELGFQAAVTTAWGAADQRADPFQIPRFTPWDLGRTMFGARLARNLLQREVEKAA